MRDNLPCWRSMLFVPVNVEKFVNTGADRGADAIILDLEGFDRALAEGAGADADRRCDTARRAQWGGCVGAGEPALAAAGARR